MAFDRLACQRAYRQRNRNFHTRVYEKSPKGFLMRTYRNMQSRVTGVQRKKAHLYQGLALLPRREFYSWALADPDFWTLYETWTIQGYPQRLTPSVNRRDSSMGYSTNNMEWITHSQNSALGNLSRRSMNGAAAQSCPNRP